MDKEGQDMRSLVTGVAGFIGSHLAERLLAEGHEVAGVDCFTPYYSRSAKEANLKGLLGQSRFTFVEGDLLRLDMRSMLQGISYVFHQAAQAGVRSSWGKEFEIYTSLNVLATQQLLEACKGVSIERFVYASSSSVYGDAPALPLSEDSLPQPVSPYGVTKLAAEHLCHTYACSYAIPVVSLRYFTVYGPRQRPDMAFHRFMRSIIKGEEIEVYGDGSQTRDFTFVADAVEANMLAMQCARRAAVFNIGGGSRVMLKEVLDTIQEISENRARVKYLPGQTGDMKHTMADTARAQGELGYRPRVSLKAGLEAEWDWMQAFYR
jgi:UDP-glucose 4-epimerase